MQINSNNYTGNVARVAYVSSNGKANAPKGDNVQFEQTAALERSLKETPDVRSDVVDRAKDLVSSPNYPPPEVIKRISNLLAIHLSNESDIIV